MKYCVWYGVAVALLAASTWASAKTKSDSQISVQVKPKREAPLSSSGSNYHGPTYKYLPPAPASAGVSANGYDSYSSHGSSSSGLSASGGAGIGYDFGGDGAPKVETYIVQTEPAHGGYTGGASSHGGSSFGYSNAGHSSAGGSGYRYSSGGPHLKSGASALLGHSSFGNGGGGGGGGNSYKHYAKARPRIQTFIVPVSSLTHGGSSGAGDIHSSGSYNGGHLVHSHGGSGSSNAGFGSIGYQYAPSIASLLHSGGGGFGTAHSSGLGAGHSGGIAFGGHSGYSSGFGAHGGNSVTYNPQQGYDYSGHGGSGSALFGLSSNGHGAQDGHDASGTTFTFANHGDYSGNGYAQSAPSIPSTNYGVPAGPAITKYSGAGNAGNSYQSSGYETPIYAVGHKGLGHFSFSSSKPQALHTTFTSSANAGHSEHSGRAPFKPSTLLGTTHEISGPAAQYLPPTSAGYEYELPSALHGGGSAAGEAVPESSYLPPAATPGASYLPPHQH